MLRFELITATVVDPLLTMLKQCASTLRQWQRRLLKRRMHRQIASVHREIFKRNANRAVIHALGAGRLAEQLRDRKGLKATGLLLLQLGEVGPGWQLQCAGQRLKWDCPLPEWRGEDLADRRLLIRPAKSSSIGKAIRYARFIEPALRRTKRCIILAEPRMVPILRRTFPTLHVRAREDMEDAMAQSDVVATFEMLAMHFANSEKALRSSLIALQADRERVAGFQTRYRQYGCRDLIGISWWSNNSKKDLPDLRAWHALLNRESTTFVSLQYSYDGYLRDLNILRSLTAARILHDETVDQFTDIDTFAAQVAALDAVVTVSNTTVHVAGDFEIPTIVLREDSAYGMWPISGPTPWYPDMTLIYRSDRPWSFALAEARERLDQILSERPAAQELSGP